MSLDSVAWEAYRINLASQPGLMQRPSIRSLYYDGLDVDTIADAAGITVDLVRDALNVIP